MERTALALVLVVTAASAQELPPRVRPLLPHHPALLERLAREGHQGVLALSGEKLLLVDGEPIAVSER